MLNEKRFDATFVFRLIGIVFFAYLFFGFMLVPCWNTLTSIFKERRHPERRILSRSSGSSWRAT